MKKFLRLVIAVTIISFTHMLLLTAKVYRIEYAAYMTNNDDGISFHQDVDDVTKINGSDPNADDLSSSKNEDDGDDEDDEKEEKEDKEDKDSILELKELEEELNLRKEMDITCPPELIFLQDQITEALITQILHYDKTNIPRVIHVIVETKCIRTDIYNRIKQMLETMNNYSILFHDRMDVDKVLTKERVMIPNLNDVVKCITSIEYEIDLIKLLLIWEYGGIVADLEYILGRENVLIQDKLDNNDEAFLLKNSTDSLYFPLAIGTKRSHPVVYMMIQKFISNLFQQYGDESVFKTNDDLRRHNMLEYPMRMFFPQLVSHDALKMKSQYFGLNNRSVTVFNVTADGSHDEDYGLESILLKQKNNFPCVNFESTYHMNFEDLIQISGTDKTYSCSDPLLYFEDKIDPDYNMEESRKSGRKIPKVVHMTSKSRCLTDNYTDNTASWLFPGHSIVLHDDDAVARLMQRKWPEFPHLHDARKCITSGAGMADVWRYLVLWEYGGVYTDIDNAPGPRFLDGSLIKNEMDAFLEVESGSFPSQYFMAVSPHHPLSYFAVNVAMQRLFEEQNIVQQYVPYITGPGALKVAMIHTIANGNPINGTHVGVHNRSVTMVGNRYTARHLEFINRGSVSNHEYKKMNMTHYSIAGRQKDKPRKPCLQVLYEEYYSKTKLSSK